MSASVRSPLYAPDEIVSNLTRLAEAFDNNEYTHTWRGDRDFLRWLAGALHEMMADRALLDVLVRSPAGLMFGTVTLREARDQYRAASRVPSSETPTNG